jgi:DHA2 family multidrug resistance protein
LNLRVVASFAFIVFAFVSFWNSTFTLDVPFNHVIWPRIVQGIGVACFFVPMTTITLSSVSDERLASASGLSNFFRTLSGAIGTAISTTYWENDTIRHHAMLVDNVNVYTPNTNAYTDALAGVGFSGGSITAQLEQVVTAQAYMLATNDFFRISCAAFLVLAVLVWITKPRKGVGPSMGH